MLRIATISIIASVMLALVVMAGYELTKEPPATLAEVQDNTEAVDEQGAETSPETSQDKASRASIKSDSKLLKTGQSDPEGVLVPLDEGTVRADAKVERRSLPSVSDTPAPTEKRGIKKKDVPQGKAAISIGRTEKKAEQASVRKTAKTAPIQKSAPARTLKNSAGSVASLVPVPNIPPLKPPVIVLGGKLAVAKKGASMRPAEKLIVIVSDAPAKKGAGQDTITRMRLEVGPRRLALRCIGDMPLKASYFVLTDPPRLVLDLRGDWALQLPRIPKNTLLKSFRRGKQEGRTRIVLDLFRVPKTSKLVQINDTSIEVRLF